jgi:hypothetical protein
MLGLLFDRGGERIFRKRTAGLRSHVIDNALAPRDGTAA